MSLPPSTHPVWLRLAGGAISNLQTQHLGTQLLTKRIVRGAEPVAFKAAEIYSFFSKWERALSAEVQQLSRL